MSSNYKFEITNVAQTGTIDWKLTNRLGAVWTGKMVIIDTEENENGIQASLNIDQVNSPIPQKGLSLIKFKLTQFVSKAIKQSIAHNHHMGVTPQE